MTHTYDLINRARLGDKQAEKKLIDENLPLVHSCVRKLIRPGYEYDDLVQIGTIGLLKALRRFNTNLGLKLSTYAVPLIMGEIKRSIRDNTQLKVSRGLRELWIKAVKVRRQLTNELFREPTIGEIASCIGTDTEKLNLAMEACMPCESIYRSVTNNAGDSTYIADTLTNNTAQDDNIEKIALKAAISSLDERDKKIILLRYFRGKTQTEVSQIIGVSQVQISRLEKKVLAKLKEKMQ